MLSQLTIKRIQKLYYKDGRSVLQIAVMLGISARTIYALMRRHRMVRRSAAETNRIRYEHAPLSFKWKKSLSIRKQELATIGLMLYWGEGAKTGDLVDFANSDSKMIQLFLRFLRDVCQVTESRLRGYLYCYRDQPINTLKKFWREVTGLPSSQFSRPHVRDDFLVGGRKMRRGLLHVRYSDKKLLTLILQKIGEVHKKFVGG